MSRVVRAAMPPGYLGFNSPLAFKVRQYGVIRVAPSASLSPAAWAAIQAKMPVVMGQPTAAPCLRAMMSRRAAMVARLPLGTCRISSSTSRGAGMAQVAPPRRAARCSIARHHLGQILVVGELFAPGLAATQRAPRPGGAGFLRGAHDVETRRDPGNMTTFWYQPR